MLWCLEETQGDVPKSSRLSGDARAHGEDTQVCGHQPVSNWLFVAEKSQSVWWRMESQGKHVPGFMGTCAVLLSPGWLRWAVMSPCHRNSPWPLCRGIAPHFVLAPQATSTQP